MTHIESAVRNFQAKFCEFGYLDIQSAIRTASDVWIDEDRLFEMSEELAEEFGQEKPIEPNFTIWNFISNDIRSQLYDKFSEDFEIEYYSNYMDSGFNISNEDLDKLKELQMDEETKEDFDELKESSETVALLWDWYSL